MLTTTIMTGNMHRDYTRLIALNNVGVSLLERGQYRLAMSTLKDALRSMPSQFRTAVLDDMLPPCAADESPEAVSRTIEKRLQRAESRLASTSNNSAFSSSASPCCQRSTSLRIQVISYQEAMCHSVLESIHRGSIMTAETACAVRIEKSVCPITVVNQREAELKAGILLYNYGLTHLCLSREAARDAAKAAMLRQGAVRLFSRIMVISNQLIKLEEQDRKSRQSANNVCHDEFEERVLLVSLLVIANLLQSIRESNQSPAAVETFFDKLIFLREVLNERFSQPLAHSGQGYMAAAAA